MHSEQIGQSLICQYRNRGEKEKRGGKERRGGGGGREGEVEKVKEEGEKQGYVNLRQAVPPAGSMNSEVV